MNLIDFVKLLLKHKIVLVAIPLFFGFMAVVLTSNTKRSYYSQTILYTGIASGSSIEMDKNFNYLANNNAFDNLINIIKSRDTQEEVAIRLLAQHLLLDGPNEAVISERAYQELQEIIPDELRQYIIKSEQYSNTSENQKVYQNWSDSDYERTVENLMKLMAKDNDNFVYSLLNFDNPHYSLEAISQLKAQRISTSDLVKLSYEADDPGICQQTLKIYNEVCIKKYKDLKENGSDAVVQYFEKQLQQSETKLKAIEQKLLKFNQENNIINYYEQSKAVAIVKEDMDVAYNRGMAQLAGSEASAKRLEEKLAIQELIQEKNNAIIESKKRLGELNYKIGMYEAKANQNASSTQTLTELREEAEVLQKEIKTGVDELYSFQNSVEGVPIKKVLPDWVDKVVETEDLKAKLEVMDGQNKAIRQQFATYAPAGANLKRIEREISVAEQEYLEILHGLNLAKLKFQDAQLSSNLKAVDPPFFPLKPIPSKRKIIIIAIVMLSGIFVLGTILFMEYFDDTLKNDQVASEKLGIPAMGMLPRISRSNKHLDTIKMQDRLMEFLMQNFNHYFKNNIGKKEPQIITVLSTRSNEGKTVIAGNIARKLKASGKKVLVLNHSVQKMEATGEKKAPWLYNLLGYEDPRIDYSHPFLANLTDYLNQGEYTTYNVDNSFQDVAQYQELYLENAEVKNIEFDVIIVELPNVLETSYPSELLAQSDLALLICRSNRLWSKADKNILQNIKDLVGSKLQFIINGVELKEVETLLGELPKKRSKIRKKIKNMLRFQFYANNHI